MTYKTVAVPAASVLAFLGFASVSSIGKKADAPRYFVITYETGPAWDQAKEPQDQAYFKEHSAFLKTLRTEKKSHIGGRYADKGMLIVSAADENEARRLLEGDASVSHGTFKAGVDELYLFQAGCLE